MQERNVYIRLVLFLGLGSAWRLTVIYFLECASSSGYKLSKDGTHCIKGCARGIQLRDDPFAALRCQLINGCLEPHCKHPIPKHSTRTCDCHGRCDFECVLGYAKSSNGLTCERACKHGKKISLLHSPVCLDILCRFFVPHFRSTCESSLLA
jgi:hypothetical protein